MIHPVGFRADEGVLPNPQNSPLGSRNLREFFAFPEKYRFFDLSKLNSVIRWEKATGFDIRFYFRRAPDAAVVIRKESIQLYCTPIVNLFSKSCKVDRDQRRVEYLVEPPEARETVHREHYEVVSVDSVRSDRGEYPRYDDLRARASGVAGLDGMREGVPRLSPTASGPTSCSRSWTKAVGLGRPKTRRSRSVRPAPISTCQRDSP